MIRPSTLAGIAALWVTTTVNVVHCQYNYLGCGAITDFDNQFYNIGPADPSICPLYCASNSGSDYIALYDQDCYCSRFSVTPAFEANPAPDDSLCTIDCTNPQTPGQKCGGVHNRDQQREYFFHDHFHFVQCFVTGELIILFLNLRNWSFYLIIHCVDNYTNDDTDKLSRLHITYIYIFSKFFIFNRFILCQCQLGCR
ncbi:hypothetical protein GQ607_003771 [Colletotrichum asianum]|uniref:WSC domain-containing protein n=1 Tax=Colletotrichum asianum TaxID=702518 RepID=A0A8H3WR85_9PEZI|nr:hypothetical protein GQ607_003771 [Colletotrichum asianum]